LDRQRALQMLKIVGDEVHKHYYDPKFHGVDFDKELADAKTKNRKGQFYEYGAREYCQCARLFG
jgi:hypothetical protein